MCVVADQIFMISRLLEPCAGCEYNSETDLITASKNLELESKIMVVSTATGLPFPASLANFDEHSLKIMTMITKRNMYAGKSS